MATIWTEENPTQTDYNFLGDDLLQILTDDSGNQIFFHTGDFNNENTQWEEIS